MKITITLTMDVEGKQAHDNVFQCEVDDNVNPAMFYDKIEDQVLGFLQSTPVVQKVE